MTYAILNLTFLMVVLGVLIGTKKLLRERRKPILLTLGILLIATAVFDSLIIHMGLVTYDSMKILGIYIGKAPVEDFAYIIVGVTLIPVLWRLNGRLNSE